MRDQLSLPLFANVDLTGLPPFTPKPGILITPINKEKKSRSQLNYLNTVRQNRKRQQWGGGSKPKTHRAYLKVQIGDIFVCFAPAGRLVLYAGYIRDIWDEGCEVGHEAVGWERWTADGGLHYDAYGRHMVHVQPLRVPAYLQNGTTSLLALLTTKLDKPFARDNVLLETLYVDYEHANQFVEQIRRLNSI